MLSFLPAPILGVLSLVLLIVNTLIWAIPLFTFSFIKLAIPMQAWRSFWTTPVLWVGDGWAGFNMFWARYLVGTRWHIDVDADLNRQSSYLLTPNHKSWSDIIAMQVALNFRVQYFRFFLKQELVWIPVLGTAFWAMDYPFMKRYTKEQIAKDPSLKGKDIETAIKSCEKYKGSAVALVNFMEGTRFTPEKHNNTQSPYKNLLKPKAGGIAFALKATEGQIKKRLDITLYYPDDKLGFWDLLSGQVKDVYMKIEEKEIPDHAYGDYENDPEFKLSFQKWVSDLWQQKDDEIEEIKKKFH